VPAAHQLDLAHSTLPWPAAIRAAAEYVMPTTRERAFPTAPWKVRSRLSQSLQGAQIQRKSRFLASNSPETLLYQRVIQWVMAQIRYLAEQWNFCTDQRISRR
jgi:hypothetical protein